MSQIVINKLRAARQSWVQLEPGKRVQIIRPPETSVGNFLRDDAGGRAMVAELEQIKKYVTGWDGITEADLLGPSVGSSDPLPFSTDLWSEVVEDHGDWLALVARALLDAIVKHFEKKAEDSKN